MSDKGKCGRWIKFIGKPESEKIRPRRPSNQRDLVAKYSKGFCEMCLRKSEELQKGHTLIAQHVIEYKDGGEAGRENIWILCNACHYMVHWLRTYFGGNRNEARKSQQHPSGTEGTQPMGGLEDGPPWREDDEGSVPGQWN